MPKSNEHLRSLPSVSAVLETLTDMNHINHLVLRSLIRDQLSQLRSKLQESGSTLSKKAHIATIGKSVRNQLKGSPKPVINATGIVLHTGLGRAPLSPKWLHQVAERLAGYADLELDLESGERGNRLNHLRSLLAALTGAETAAVVNNNAAAVLLSLNALAEGKQVVVSRGQEVEIGGSFRIPDIIRKSGAEMVEIGTTNRTHLRDYEKAITAKTGCILWVHTSNYQVEGFTAEVELTELAELARKKRIPLVADLGSGVLTDLTSMDLPYEPVVSEIVKNGADVVTFSGDKLLGGPQAGLIVGKKRFIRKIIKDPIYRAVRCDKITIALLWEALVHAQPEANLSLKLLSTSQKTLQGRAQVIYEKLNLSLVNRWAINVELSRVEAGSGSLPTQTLPSAALVFTSKSESVAEFAHQLRTGSPSIVGFINRNRFYLDLKAVLPEQDSQIVETLNSLDI